MQKGWTEENQGTGGANGVDRPSRTGMASELRNTADRLGSPHEKGSMQPNSSYSHR